MRKKILVLLACIFASMLFTATVGADTYAVDLVDIGKITDRAKIADLHKCANQFKSSIDILDFYRPSDILINPKEKKLALPNGTTNSDSLFSCKTLLDEYMGYPSSFNDNTSKANFLKQMGYAADAKLPESGDGLHCYDMTWTMGGSQQQNPTTTQIVDGVEMEVDTGARQHHLTVCATVTNSEITRIDVTSEEGVGFNIIDRYDGAVDVGDPNYPTQLRYDGKSVDEFFAELEQYAKNNPYYDVDYNPYIFGDMNKESQSGMERNEASEIDTIYRKGTFTTNMATTFVEGERLGLLAYYFKTYGKISCNWIEGTVELTVGGNKYFVSKKDNAPSTFYVVDGTSWFGEASWEDVISGLSGQDIAMPDCNGVEPPATTGSSGGYGGGANGDEEDGPCFDGGVGALGWIICPIIKLLRQTTENLYDYVITPFLEIDVGAFDTGSAVFRGWQTFQSVANILFVIFLLFVIFSQVTGYGIDNYGIKRMLPKLIVGAILVNLSFIICQLLVDASNVIGFSVENLFNGLAYDAMTESGGLTGSAGAAVGATIISGAVGIGGAAAAIATAEIWLPVLILPIILGTISIIISCLFVFIILGARRAAAIILVVISPLAFVMYMLPNTKKLFDRWLSAFKAVLLVFPICGLLMGGGAFAGAILWNVSGDFFLGQLLAALTTVIPFFFIPRILRASLNAVGNLGTTLSNLGNGISRGLGGITKGAIGNSNWYNNMQSNRKDILEERNRNREQERAQRIVDRLKARGGENGANLTEAQRRRQYRAQATLNRLQREDVEAEAGIEPISRDVELAQAQAKRRQDSISAREDQIRISKDANNLDALQNQLTAAITGEDEIGIEALQNVLSTKGDKGREAVHQAMVEAEKAGDISSKARQTYASNIVSGKFASEYKNNSRSTFDYAMNNTGESSGGNMSQFYGGSVGSLTQQKMVDMDEGELKRILGKMESGTMEDKDYETVQRIASGALSNDKLQQSLKTSQRNLLNDIVSRPAQRTTSMNIPHGGTSGTGSGSGSSGSNAADTAGDMYEQNAADTAGDMYEQMFDQQRDGGPDTSSAV